MAVWWGVRVGVAMRVCCVTVLALALRTSGEPVPARRYPVEWHARDLPRSHPLHEIFDPEPSSLDSFPRQPPPLPSGALYSEHRRTRNNKRTPHQLPSELASQMMLRASRSSRPYDVPQIGEFTYYLHYTLIDSYISRHII